MEMADYERLVKELNAKLTQKDECAEELKTQINTLTQKEEALREEIGTENMYIYNLTQIYALNDFTKYFLMVDQT